MATHALDVSSQIIREMLREIDRLAAIGAAQEARALAAENRAEELERQVAGGVPPRTST